MKLLILALALIGSAAQARTTSEYTRLDNCKILSSSENDPNAEIDYFTSVCKGRDGYVVELAGGDSRSWIKLLAKGEKLDNRIGWGLSMDEAEGQFPNIEGDKLEWRYRGGKLNALIVRVSGQDPDTLDVRTTLAVIRYDAHQEQRGCVIGVVNARDPQANLKARAIADSNAICK